MEKDTTQMTTQEQASFLNTRRQILSEKSSFSVQEAYKSLRTNLHFSLYGKECKRIGITSGTAGEGKSITMLNLAISISETGSKVLLIDADLRRPAMGRLLMEQATPGLSNVLVGLDSVETAVRKDIYPNLDILFSGDIPPNPSELLGSERMVKLVEEMSKKYDYILVDTPPINVVSDACVVASLLDGVLLLVRHNRAKKDDVKQSVARLQLTGAKLLGFVLNGVSKRNRPYSYYY